QARCVLKAIADGGDALDRAPFHHPALAGNEYWQPVLDASADRETHRAADWTARRVSENRLNQEPKITTKDTKVARRASWSGLRVSLVAFVVEKSAMRSKRSQEVRFDAFNVELKAAG